MEGGGLLVRGTAAVAVDCGQLLGKTMCDHAIKNGLGLRLWRTLHPDNLSKYKHVSHFFFLCSKDTKHVSHFFLFFVVMMLSMSAIFMVLKSKGLIPEHLLRQHVRVALEREALALATTTLRGVQGNRGVRHRAPCLHKRGFTLYLGTKGLDDLLNRPSAYQHRARSLLSLP